MSETKDNHQISAPIIWTPDPIVIGSPYLFLPKKNNFDLALRNLKIEDILNYLMYPPDENKYYQSELEKEYLNYLGFVLSDFWRKFIDKRYRGFSIPRQWDKKFKAFISAESELIGNLWRLIRLLGYDFEMPLPLVFHTILIERKLTLFIFCSEIKSEDVWTFAFSLLIQSGMLEMGFLFKNKPIQDRKTTATDYRKRFQSQNAKLLKLENPFIEAGSPYSHSFIELCIAESEKNRDFQSEYTKFVRSRMKLTALLRDQNPIVCRKGSNRIERRGRKFDSSF